MQCIINDGTMFVAPFSGLFDLKVHDEAWATGNLGIINKFIDIFRVKVCYQINFHYDLNILKVCIKDLDTWNYVHIHVFSGYIPT